jgi:hypothetical protein
MKKSNANVPPPSLEYQFSWMNHEVNPAMECKWCVIYENSPCEKDFKAMTEEPVETTKKRHSDPSLIEKTFKKCIYANKDLLQKRVTEFDKWQDDNFENIRKWNEFLDFQYLMSGNKKEKN